MLDLLILNRSLYPTTRSSWAHYVSTWALFLTRQYTDQQLGSEIWQIEAGRMSHKGKVAVVEDAFIGVKSPKGSGANTPVRSRTQTPPASVSATPVGSGAEDKGSVDSPASVVRKKKKLTRN